MSCQGGFPFQSVQSDGSALGSQLLKNVERIGKSTPVSSAYTESSRGDSSSASCCRLAASHNEIFFWAKKTQFTSVQFPPGWHDYCNLEHLFALRRLNIEVSVLLHQPRSEHWSCREGISVTEPVFLRHQTCGARSKVDLGVPLSIDTLNAFTRSMNRTHYSSPCSMCFFKADFILKIVSVVLRSGLNPHWFSWTNPSLIGRRGLCSMISTTAYKHHDTLLISRELQIALLRNDFQ